MSFWTHLPTPPRWQPLFKLRGFYLLYRQVEQQCLVDHISCCSKINFSHGIDMEMSAQNMIFVWYSKCRGYLPVQLWNLWTLFVILVSPHALQSVGLMKPHPPLLQLSPVPFTGTPFSVNVEFAETNWLLKFTPCYPYSTPNALHIHVFSIIINTS